MWIYYCARRVKTPRITRFNSVLETEIRLRILENSLPRTDYRPTLAFQQLTILNLTASLYTESGTPTQTLLVSLWPVLLQRQDSRVRVAGLAIPLDFADLDKYKMTLVYTLARRLGDSTPKYLASIYTSS